MNMMKNCEKNTDKAMLNCSKLIQKIALRLSYLLSLVFLLGFIYGIDPTTLKPPAGPFFSYSLLFIVSFFLGDISNACKLPPLLGMLIAGFIIANLTDIKFSRTYSSVFRQMALSVILLRAGLGLNPDDLLKISNVCLRLAFTPCTIEAFSICFFGHFLLDLPFLWSLLLGFVLSAVSPAVVVHCMIELQKKKLGTSKGIPTLVMASSSVDDILAITGFGVVLSMVISSKASVALTLLKGPLEAFAGLAIGGFCGYTFWFYPFLNGNHPFTRALAIISAGLCWVALSNHFEVAGIGPLAALTTAFVAALRWRSEEKFHEIEVFLEISWILLEPMLFSLIGVEVLVKNIKSGFVFHAICVVVIGLAFRSLAAYCSVSFSGLSHREKIFTTIAWLPKATVQAATGSVALDLAREHNDIVGEHYGEIILTVAFIAIFLTAPLGAAAIPIVAEKLLAQDEKPSIIEQNKAHETAQNNEFFSDKNVKISLEPLSSPKRTA